MEEAAGDTPELQELLVASEEKQLEFLSQLQKEPERIHANLPGYWSALQTLAISDGLAVNHSALACATHFLSACEVNAFSVTFASRAFSLLSSLLKHSETSTDPQESLPCLQHAAGFLTYFTSCLTMIPEGWKTDLPALQPLLNLALEALILSLTATTKTFKAWTAKLVKLGIPKETIATLTGANTAIYSEAIVLLQQVSAFVGQMPVVPYVLLSDP